MAIRNQATTRHRTNPVASLPQNQPSRRGRSPTPRDNGVDTSTKRPDSQPSSPSPARHWISCIAIFGDSWLSLFLSFGLFIFALVLSYWVDGSITDSPSLSLKSLLDLTGRTQSDSHNLGPLPYLEDPPRIFSLNELQGSDIISAQFVQAYARDGVVAIRGLIDAELLRDLDEQSAQLVEVQKSNNQKQQKKKKKQTQFFMNVHGAMFQHDNHDEAPSSSASFKNSPALNNAFLRLAITSLVPKLAAELLQATEKGVKDNDSNIHSLVNNNLRVLRDIFLAKDDEPYVCGWHVDDLGFWPALADAPGINAWIALDDMPIEHGGGFALAVSSHRYEAARSVIGAPTVDGFPLPDGYQSAADMVARRTGAGTCNLKRGAPHWHNRMEETKRVYPLKRGDVIFHDRWLFHRTIPFNRTFLEERKGESPDSDDDDDSPIYRRYSIRYSPGSARIPPGYGTELSVLHDPSNGGRTADQVSQQYPWYPQAWPKPSDAEVTAMTGLVQDVMPGTEALRTERHREMKPHIQRMAQRRDREQARQQREKAQAKRGT